MVEAPLLRPEERRRNIFVSPALAGELAGRNLARALPFGAIRENLIGPFVRGEVLTISWTRREQRSSSRRNRHHPQLEKLEGYDEIWVLCQREPRPGWRLSGRFLSKDVLVLLDFRHKDEIGNNYASVSASVIHQWQRLFGCRLPHTGTDISGYVGGTFSDYDELMRSR